MGMGSKPRSPSNTSVKKTTIRSSDSHKHLRSSSVSDKLEALKNLIPPAQTRGEIKTDQLFQETADYIVLLKTQVFVLQTLIHIHGSSSDGYHCDTNHKAAV